MRELNVPKAPSFPALVQSFFTEYLVMQRAVSHAQSLVTATR